MFTDPELRAVILTHDEWEAAKRRYGTGYLAAQHILNSLRMHNLFVLSRKGGSFALVSEHSGKVVARVEIPYPYDPFFHGVQRAWYAARERARRLVMV